MNSIMKQCLLTFLVLFLVITLVNAQDNSSTIYGIKVTHSRFRRGDIDLLRPKVKLDVDFAAAKLFIEKALNALECNASNGIYTLDSRTVTTIYTNGKCDKVDVQQIIEDFHIYALNINVETLMDDLQISKEKQKDVTIYRKAIKINNIEINVAREEYPAECFSGSKPLCMGKKNPSCDIPCGPLAPCEIEEASKYCTAYEGCHPAPKSIHHFLESEYWCGSSASTMSITSVVVVAIISVLSLVL